MRAGRMDSNIHRLPHLLVAIYALPIRLGVPFSPTKSMNGHPVVTPGCGSRFPKSDLPQTEIHRSLCGGGMKMRWQNSLIMFPMEKCGRPMPPDGAWMIRMDHPSPIPLPTEIMDRKPRLLLARLGYWELLSFSPKVERMV